MSHFDYATSRLIEAEQYPFYALVMAAMRQADSSNQITLAFGFPAVWKELQERYNAPGGVLPSDDSEGGLTITVVEDQPSFTCPACGKTSYNPNDIKHQYCGFCHTFPEMRNKS